MKEKKKKLELKFLLELLDFDNIMIPLTFISASLFIWNLLPDFVPFGPKFLFSSFPIQIS